MCKAGSDDFISLSIASLMGGTFELASLVSRPFPAPVFDCLQKRSDQKLELGKAWI